jgi:uncharacterized delta-60 repeat protein
MLLRSIATAGLATLAVAAAPAAPAAAAVAPGRVLFATTQAPVSNVDAGGAGPAVALPDGGVVMVTYDRTLPAITTVALRPDGSPNPAYGSGGTSRVTRPAGFSPQQILRQPDGRLVIVGERAAATKYQLPRLTLVRLMPNGALDPSFGAGGIAALELQGSAAALAPDGSFVVTGSVGEISPAIEHDPYAPATFRWVVLRLTAAGTIDPAFGAPVIPGAESLNTGGRAVVVRPSGQIVVLGTHAMATQLAGLTAAGSPDLSFNGGAPITLGDPGNELLMHAGGAIDVAGNSHVVRFTAAGTLDASFGAGGVATFGGFNPSYGPPSMLAAPDGGTLLCGQTLFEAARAGLPRLHVLRITPAGTPGAATGLEPRFGGGYASSPHSPTVGTPEQNGFRGALLARPDGSYLAVGETSVVAYSGEGTGRSAGFAAIAAYSPLLAPDDSYGGPQQAARATVSLPRQRARSDYDLRRVLVHVRTNGPGLVLLRIRDGHRRVLAQTVAAAFTAGPATLRAALTKTGRSVLRRGRSLRVIAGVDFRDVLTARSNDAITARLR